MKCAERHHDDGDDDRKRGAKGEGACPQPGSAPISRPPAPSGSRSEPPMRSALSQLDELCLNGIQIVGIHVDHVSFSCFRTRASPRLTRLRITISEHRSSVAISR